MQIKEKRIDLINKWQKYNIYIIFIVILFISGIISPQFFTKGNLLNLLRQQSFLIIVSIGMLLTILTGGIDLSIGSTFCLSAVLTAILIEKNMSPLLAISLVLGVGVFIGCANGYLISKYKIPAFINTLASMSILRGLAYIFSHGEPVYLWDKTSKGFEYLGTGMVGPIHFSIIISLGIAVIFYAILSNTTFGRITYAIGGNIQVVKFSGIRPDGYIIGVYAISGFLSALAGILACSRLGMAQATMGNGMELNAIAAVVLGGGSLAGGVGSIGGTVIGAILIGLIRNILNLLNVSSYIQKVVKGVIIIMAILLARLQTKNR